MIVKKFIMHHSATKDSGTVSWGAIRRYHVQECRWLDIGYHWGIEYIDSVPEILMGRIPTMPGAHTKGHNYNSLGICIVGDFDEEAPPMRQWNKAVELVGYLLEMYQLEPSDVYPHRDFANKTCPGIMFDMLKFRKDLGE